MGKGNDDSIFIVDVCGTLYRSNTTFDFLDFYFHSKRWHRVLRLFRQVKLLAVLNAVAFKLLNKDLLRMWAVSHLKGYRQSELADMAERFHKEFLLHRENDVVLDIVRREKSSGRHIVIVSATLDCIADAVGKEIGADEVFSSRLAYDSGICKGRLSEDLLACKLHFLSKRNILPPFWGVVTDNYSDKDIIMESQNAYLVQYVGKRDRWNFVGKLNECNVKKILING